MAQRNSVQTITRQKLDERKKRNLDKEIDALGKELSHIPASLKVTWTACTSARQHEFLQRYAAMFGENKQWALRHAIDTLMTSYRSSHGSTKV